MVDRTEKTEPITPEERLKAIEKRLDTLLSYEIDGKVPYTRAINTYELMDLRFIATENDRFLRINYEEFKSQVNNKGKKTNNTTARNH